MKVKLIFILALLCTVCNRIKSQNLNSQWIKSGGGAQTQSGTFWEGCRSLAFDSKGNIYSTSAVGQGSIIDTSNHAGKGYDDIAIFSYNCQGQLRWVRYITAGQPNRVAGLVIDNNDNIFVCGETFVGADTLYNATIIDTTFNITGSFLKSEIIVKLDTAGNRKGIYFPNPTNHPTFRIDNFFIDKNGNFVIIGFPYTNDNWGTNIFIQGQNYMLNIDKNTMSVSKIIKLDFDGIIGVEINYDKDENSFYLYGNATPFNKKLVIGSNFIDSTTNSLEIVILKFDSIGIVKWFKNNIANNNGRIIAIKGAPIVYNGIAYVSLNGGNEGTWFLTDTLKNLMGTQPNAFYIGAVGALNAATGAPLWQKCTGNTTSLYGFETRMSKDGFLYYNGMWGNIKTLDNGDTLQHCVDANDYWIMKLDTTSKTWVEGNSYATNNDWGKGNQMVINNKNDIYIGGSHFGDLTDNHGATIGVNGHADFFIAKLGVGNNCNCTTAKAIPNIASYSNTLLTVNGSSIASVDSMYWLWGDGTKTKYTNQGVNVQHNYSSLGAYNVCLRTYNNCGINDTCFSLMLTSVNDIASSQLLVFPNPADDYFVISNSTSLNGAYYLFDNTGRIILNGVCNNANTKVISSTLVNGIYMLQIKLENGQVGYRKLLIE
jgi:Secretion system C-terminal sorting domain